MDLLVYAPAGAVSPPDATLRYAARLATQARAHLTAISFAFEMPATFSLYSRSADGKVAATRNQELEAAADRVLAHARTLITPTVSNFNVVKETCALPDAGQILVNHGRLYDVVVMPNRTDKDEFEIDLLEAVLFGTGHPALLVPEPSTREFGFERIVVGWDHSRAAARAAADALPLLRHAKKVDVVMVTEEKIWPSHLSGVEFARYLSRHGVNVSLSEQSRRGESISATLIAEAQTLGADLLVIGGFGHSRLRDFVLGGTTKDVLAGAPVPVFLSH